MSKSPLDFACYLCGSAVGAFCVTAGGSPIDPHKVRVRAARRGEETPALRARSTIRSKRPIDSLASKHGVQVRLARMRDAAATLPPAPVLPSPVVDTYTRPKGACTNCDELGHNRVRCPRGVR